jgi:hypothetical protein
MAGSGTRFCRKIARQRKLERLRTYPKFFWEIIRSLDFRKILALCHCGIYLNLQAKVKKNQHKPDALDIQLMISKIHSGILFYKHLHEVEAIAVLGSHRLGGIRRESLWRGIHREKTLAEIECAIDTYLHEARAVKNTVEFMVA